MSGRRASAIGAALLAIAAPGADATAGEPPETVLEPAGAWRLEYAQDKCRMVRPFGSENAPTLFVIEQYEPGDQIITTIAGPGVARLGSSGEVAVRFGTRFGEVIDRRSPPRVAIGYGTAVYLERYKPSEPGEPAGEDLEAVPVVVNRLAASDGAAIDQVALSRGRERVRLATGNFEPVFEAMNACTRDLVDSWGLSPETLDQVASGPRWTNASAVAQLIQADYPVIGLRRGEQSDLHLRVTIEVDGRVSDCHVTQMTASDFGDRPCRTIIEHARFEPALDREGRPMRYFYVTNIRYRLR